MSELEYIGKIESEYAYEGGLRIGEHSLIEIIQEVENYLGRDIIIHVSYFIADEPLNKSQFLENHLLTVFGAPDMSCNDIHGSEWTGYMFTDQQFKIGGHDLLEELKNCDGKYCYLKVYNAVEKRNMAIDDVFKKN